MNQLCIKRQQVAGVIFLSCCSFSGGINLTMALESLCAFSKEIIFMVWTTFFFLLHLRFCFFQGWMSKTLELHELMSWKQKFLSFKIRCRSSEMWKTCWFTLCRWPLFACVWHCHCACDSTRMCVSCVFIFWHFQQELPKVKRGRLF